jgi:hypothetical protein
MILRIKKRIFLDLEAGCYCETTEDKASFFIKGHEPYTVSQLWTSVNIMISAADSTRG